MFNGKELVVYGFPPRFIYTVLKHETRIQMLSFEMIYNLAEKL